MLRQTSSCSLPYIAYDVEKKTLLLSPGPKRRAVVSVPSTSQRCRGLPKDADEKQASHLCTWGPLTLLRTRSLSPPAEMSLTTSCREHKQACKTGAQQHQSRKLSFNICTSILNIPLAQVHNGLRQRLRCVSWRNLTTARHSRAGKKIETQFQLMMNAE